MSPVYLLSILGMVCLCIIYFIYRYCYGKTEKLKIYSIDGVVGAGKTMLLRHMASGASKQEEEKDMMDYNCLMWSSVRCCHHLEGLTNPLAQEMQQAM